MPDAGIVLAVHSAWSGPHLPPATQTLLRKPTASDEPLQFNLYNPTYGGVTGLHFDPMFSVAARIKTDKAEGKQQSQQVERRSAELEQNFGVLP